MKLIDSLHFKNVFFENAIYDHATLFHAAQDMANYIDKNIINNSPFVHLIASNNIKTLVGMLAIMKLGKIVVIVDPQSKPLEREEYCSLAMPCATINPDTATEFCNYPLEICINPNKQTPLITSNLTDVQFVLFTNAENGTMKAAMLTADNVLNNLVACQEADIMYSGRTCCGLLPFSHIFGLVSGVLIPATSGANIAIYDISKYQEFRSMTQFIQQTGVTTLYSSPLMYYFFTKVVDIEERMSNVHSFFSGGIKLERNVYDSFLQKAGKEIHEGYGLTEACGIAACNHYGRALMPDTVGTALSCGTVGLFENGVQIFDTNKTAEICVKGSGIMRGFLNNQGATDEVITNGWLHTGDLGHLTDTGYIKFDGMKKRMLNAAGINVYPAEIERFMKQNLSIIDKIEVFGEHKPMLGHSVLTNISLTENTPENQQLVKNWAIQNLSPFKVPKRWNFVE